MRKNLKAGLTMLLLIVVIVQITYSYAIVKVDGNIGEKLFFEISKLEVTKNEKIEMVLNLDTIQYDNFTFELTASENIENVEIKQSNNIIAEKGHNEIIMKIDKEKTNINTINLYYSVPENKNVGDTIKFVAVIENIVNETTEQSTENETINKLENKQEEQNNANITNNEKEIINETNMEVTLEQQKIEFEVMIVEEHNENSDEQLPITEEFNASSTNKQSTTQNMYTNTQYAGMNNGSSIVQVTYKGSDNSYLSELSVEGYKLNKEFSKDNTTYFVTIENEIEELDIKTIADDSKSTVFVYGNENLKEGTNKVLISVTAENGNVRNYRIYVMKEG